LVDEKNNLIDIETLIAANKIFKPVSTRINFNICNKSIGSELNSSNKKSLKLLITKSKPTYEIRPIPNNLITVPTTDGANHKIKIESCDQNPVRNLEKYPKKPITDLSNNPNNGMVKTPE
jgi:hypothetical protein